MRIRWSILLLANWCFLCGCQRKAEIPGDSFRLTVQKVVSDSDVRVSLLTIRLSRGASISVDGEGFHSHVVLPDAQEGVFREGEVAVSAARVAPSQGKSAYIQTLICPQTSNGARAGGPSVYTVPTETKLASVLSLSATDGVYKLDSPVTIAQLEGKPVTLVVGRPTK
jgi:hypothetical protein